MPSFTVIGVYEERFEAIACTLVAPSRSAARDLAEPVLVAAAGEDVVIVSIIDGRHEVYDDTGEHLVVVGKKEARAKKPEGGAA